MAMRIREMWQGRLGVCGVSVCEGEGVGVCEGVGFGEGWEFGGKVGVEETRACCAVPSSLNKRAA